MDWTSVNQAAKTWSQSPLSITTLLDICERRDELVVLLTNLLKELKRCKTVQECATMHPQAGPLLTSLSQNRALLLDSTACTLIASCLFEYSKTWDAVEADLRWLDKSKPWCVHRLRYFFNASSNSTPPTGPLPQGPAKLFPAAQLANALGIHGSDLSRRAAKETADAVSRCLDRGRELGRPVTPEILHRISTSCIPLLNYPDAYALVLDVVRHAVLQNTPAIQNEKDSAPPLLSPLLVERLMFQHRDVYEAWDVDVKVGLCLLSSLALEHELLTLLTPLLLPPTQPYASPATLRRRLSHSWLARETGARPILFWRVFDILTALVGEHGGDWRVVRVVAAVVGEVAGKSDGDGRKEKWEEFTFSTELIVSLATISRHLTRQTVSSILSHPPLASSSLSHFRPRPPCGHGSHTPRFRTPYRRLWRISRQSRPPPAPGLDSHGGVASLETRMRRGIGAKDNGKGGGGGFVGGGDNKR
ncbi:hypothetical protein BC936DRAFT_137644 [Jimgerdemannia flammicorona]|uniref:Uncharacterized protein n=1 Tax=Jimgerdemannia flammicorona TaxID=994334 RepID=A0A433DIW9_9FUNG|nr:hypothetical protein BC936DRAFT_137644 [Jimgerdemannia flammicorona]